MMDNPLLLTDSYKLTHWKQYPPGTQFIYSYFESRGGRFPSVLFFGLQYFLKRYLAGPVVTRERIDEAEALTAAHLGDGKLFNREGWEHILNVHGGRLPVRIRAVPEGTTVPVHNVLATIENTDPNAYWLTNLLETVLVQVWYPTTVATLSGEMKRLLGEWMDRTAGHREGLAFKLHDFGFRGVSSPESAGIGAAAHLLNFRGTDTIAGLLLAREYYGEPMAGFSIPAAEHSTITSWGRDHEREAYANMLEQFPRGLVAVVSDSYDVYHACRSVWGAELRERVLQRDGTVVIRPDSGDPATVVVNVLEILGERFGYRTNGSGYRVLDPHVRLIQGDGVNYDSTAATLERIAAAGWSTENVTFGMGGALLQKLDRDTQRFAFKCSHAVVDGEEREVSKDPVTDPGKRSKPGRLKLIRDAGVLRTVPEGDPGEDQLVEVFRDGRLLREWSLAECRERLDTALG